MHLVLRTGILQKWDRRRRAPVSTNGRTDIAPTTGQNMSNMNLHIERAGRVSTLDQEVTAIALRERNPGLDGLRAAACLIVMLFHWLSVFYPTAILGHFVQSHSAYETYWFESPFWFLSNGEFAVAVFFGLSGFVLTSDLFDRTQPSTLYRRALGRIVRLGIPAGISSILAGIMIVSGLYFVQTAALQTGASALFAGYFDFSSPIMQFLSNLFGSTWFGSPTAIQLYNPVLWTMSIEFQGSMLGFVSVLILRTVRYRSAILFLLVAFLMALDSTRGVYLATMASGTALASLKPRRIPVAIAMAMAILGCVLGSYNSSPAFERPATDIHCLGAVLVVVATIWCNRIAGIFAKPPLPFLGRISFSCYLLHQPILFSVVCWVFLKTNTIGFIYTTLLSFAIFTSATLFFAIIFEAYIDQPSRTLARKFGYLGDGLVCRIRNRM
jgi:peptidoglycan/LPS O-acetylase OafA/YrhL